MMDGSSVHVSEAGTSEEAVMSRGYKPVCKRLTCIRCRMVQVTSSPTCLPLVLPGTGPSLQVPDRAGDSRV